MRLGIQLQEGTQSIHTYQMDTVENPTRRPHEDPSVCARQIGRALEVIGHKWTAPIVITLSDLARPARFTEISRQIPGITQKELTKRLREMEAAGLVGRKVYPVVPPRVEYWLTELGASLHPLLTGLAGWANRYAAVLEENRERYRAEQGESA